MERAMKLGIVLLAAATTLVLGPVARAQSLEPTSIAAPAEVTPIAEASTVALARQYFDAIGFEGQLGAILTNLTAPEQLGARKDLTADEREAIVSSAAEAMDDAMPMMIDEAARITARTFTPAQLQDMIAFYETESGKAIAAKTSVLPPMATQLVLTFAPLIRADTVLRACEKVDCAAEPAAKI